MPSAQTVATSPATEAPRPDKPLKLSDRVLMVLAALLGAAILRLYAWSVKLRFEGEEHVLPFHERGENVILAFWHGRLIFLPYCYRGKGIKLLISTSKDGEILTRLIRRYKFHTVRGSSTRGGAEARHGLRDAVESGWDVGLTPDGPKGPRYKVKSGIIELARATGRPVMPLTLAASKGKWLRSWDHFLLPLPGAEVVVAWGAPLFFPPEEDFEAARLRLEVELNNHRRRHDDALGNPDSEP